MLIGSWGTGSDPVSRTATLKVITIHVPRRARGRLPLTASRRWWSLAGRRNLSKTSLRMPENLSPTVKNIRIIINSPLAQHPPRPPVVFPAVATNIHAAQTPPAQQRQVAFKHLPVSSVRKVKTPVSQLGQRLRRKCVPTEKIRTDVRLKKTTRGLLSMNHMTSVRLAQSLRWRWSCMVIVPLVVFSIQTPVPAPPTVQHSRTSCLQPRPSESVVLTQSRTLFARRAQRFPKQPTSIWKRLGRVCRTPTGIPDLCWWRSIWVCSQRCPRSPGTSKRASAKRRRLQEANRMREGALKLLQHRNSAKAAKRVMMWEITSCTQVCYTGLVISAWVTVV